MSRAIDLIITYRVVKLLVTPFNKFKAYELGIIDDEGKNAVGELPQALDINVGYQIIPQQIPDSYGKHFGKVGTQDVRGEDGLPWLPDFYQNDGVSAVERYEGLGSSNPPEPAESTPEQGEPEDRTEPPHEDSWQYQFARRISSLWILWDALYGEEREEAHNANGICRSQA